MIVPLIKIVVHIYYTSYNVLYIIHRTAYLQHIINESVYLINVRTLNIIVDVEVLFLFVLFV